MPTNEELQTTIQDLQNQVSALQTIIGELRTTINQHVGTSFGAVQQNTPHPKQLIQTATFGGGSMRIDNVGMQIITPNYYLDGNNAVAIYFSDQFRDDISLITPKAYISGGSALDADDSPTGSSGLELKVIHSDSASLVTSMQSVADSSYLDSIAVDGAEQSWFRVMASAANGSYFQFSGAPIQLSGTNVDYTQLAGQALGTGFIWYDTDLHRIKVYTANGTKTVTMEGDGSTLTISSGAVTVTGNYHKIDTESSAATDDLTDINGGVLGQILVIRSVNSGRDVAVKETGNIRLAGSFTLADTDYTLTLIFDGTNWYEISRATSSGA